MRNNLEILDFRIFIAIFESANFRQASEFLNISQPALSRRLQAMETAVGAVLFERTTRKVAPTRAGRSLEPGIRRMLREYEDCLFTLGDFGVPPSGRLTIATVPTAASAFLPIVLGRFRALYPNVDFRIRDLPPREGLESVVRGEAEFGINTIGASQAEVRFTPLVDDDFVLACRVDHPFANQDSVRWADLKDQPLIVSQKSDNRMVIDQALSRYDLQFDWLFQVNHLATSFGLVEAGLGISIVPRLSRPVDPHPLIAVVPIRSPVVTRTIGIVERRGRQLSRTASALREMIVEAFQ